MSLTKIVLSLLFTSLFYGCYSDREVREVEGALESYRIRAIVVSYFEDYPLIYKRPPYPETPDPYSGYAEASVLEVLPGSEINVGSKMIIFFEEDWPVSKLLKKIDNRVEFEITKRNLEASTYVEDVPQEEPFIFAAALLGIRELE